MKRTKLSLLLVFVFPHLQAQQNLSQEAVKEFGSTFAVGDFNKDGYMDIAIGAPASEGSEGRVFVYKGTRNGLSFWQSLDQKGLGSNEAGDQFGASLTSGDFNGDGYADLAVGLPGESPSSDPKSGYVMVFKGSGSTLSAWQGLNPNALGRSEAEHFTVDNTADVYAAPSISRSTAMSAIEIYPNPTHQKVNIISSIKDTTPIKISLRNLSGKIIKEKSFVSEMESDLTLDINDVKKGVYIMYISVGNEQFVKKLAIGW